MPIYNGVKDRNKNRNPINIAVKWSIEKNWRHEKTNQRNPNDAKVKVVKADVVFLHCFNFILQKSIIFFNNQSEKY